MRRSSEALIVSPRPVPPCSRAVDASACPKACNTVSSLSGGMPGPVSETSKRKVTDSAKASVEDGVMASTCN